MPARQINWLEDLQRRLSLALTAALSRPEKWSDEAADKKMVDELRKRHETAGPPPSRSSIASAIAYFCKTGEPDGWRGMKMLCFGVAIRDERGWCLLSDNVLRTRLFSWVERQQEAHKRLRCFQGLLSSYWSFPETNTEGWRALRQWLDSRLDSIQRDVHRKPLWLQTLLEHRNLLQEHPCDRYGPKLLAGEVSEFEKVMSALGISSDSWVREEAVVAQIRVACRLDHHQFVKILPDVLKIATGRAGLNIVEALQKRCIALLVSRYTKVPGTPEHPQLRDAAVSVIGNPWIRRVEWDAYVRDESGRPDDRAREMVLGWLKQRLIKDFFELLSADGVGDRRRLAYWLRFELVVEDMWFALGTNARNNRSEAFKDFRARAKGRLLNLEGTTADNNAFVMKIRGYVVIEFGEIGNALYLFRWEGLPPSVVQKLLSGKERVDVTIHELKSKGACIADEGSHLGELGTKVRRGNLSVTRCIPK